MPIYIDHAEGKTVTVFRDSGFSIIIFRISKIIENFFTIIDR